MAEYPSDTLIVYTGKIGAGLKHAVSASVGRRIIVTDYVAETPSGSMDYAWYEGPNEDPDDATLLHNISYTCIRNDFNEGEQYYMYMHTGSADVITVTDEYSLYISGACLASGEFTFKYEDI